MVLQVGTDAWDVGNHGDAQRLQQCCRPEPRQLQELGRIESAGGEDNLAVGVRHVCGFAAPVLDADRTPPGKQDTGRQRLRHHGEVCSRARLPQIADRGGAATPAPRRELEVSGAFLGRTVEVVVAGEARLLRSLDEGLAQRVRLADIGDRERTAGAVQRIGAALLVLGPPEVGQHVLETPAGIAELAPVVVVGGLAADIEKPVDRARSAQHLAARLDDAPVVELGLRLRGVEPVDFGVVEQLAVAERDVDPDVAVGAARLQQQHAVAARRGEAIGEHAARRAGADDDVVEDFFVGHGVRHSRGRHSGALQRRQACAACVNLAACSEPGIHNHSYGLWIPGSRLRRAPE